MSRNERSITRRACLGAGGLLALGLVGRTRGEGPRPGRRYELEIYSTINLQRAGKAAPQKIDGTTDLAYSLADGPDGVELTVHSLRAFAKEGGSRFQELRVSRSGIKKSSLGRGEETRLDEAPRSIRKFLESFDAPLVTVSHDETTASPAQLFTVTE